MDIERCGRSNPQAMKRDDPHVEPGQHQDEKTIMWPIGSSKPPQTQRIVKNMKKWTHEEEMMIERTYMQPSFWGCGKWDDLAEKMGVTKEQMKNHVDYLVKKGVLKKERNVRVKRVNPNWWTDSEKMTLAVIMRTYKKGIWIKKAMLHLGKSQRSIYYMSRKLKLGM